MGGIEKVIRWLLGCVAVGLLAGTVYLYSIPHMPAGVTPGSNDHRALAVLRDLVEAQDALRESGALDRDGDGRGEYGFFGDLEAADRTKQWSSRPIEVGRPARGHVRSGYRFQIVLADSEGRVVGEGVPDRATDADRAELRWACYAWPTHVNRTGKRVYFVDESGEVHWRYTAGFRWSEGMVTDDGVFAPALSAEADRAALAWQPL